MARVREMLEASPVPIEFDLETVAKAIEACLTCAQTCTSCANSDVAEEEDAAMSRCAALCVNCADICTMTARILSRPFASDHRITHHVLRACVLACTSSAEECERHAAHHRHCATCAQACRACLHAGQELLQAEAFKALEKLAGG